MNVWSNVYVYPYVQILKLGIHQGVDTDAPDAGLKRSRGHRNTLPYLQGRFLPVQGTDLRILDQL